MWVKDLYNTKHSPSFTGKGLEKYLVCFTILGLDKNGLVFQTLLQEENY